MVIFKPDAFQIQAINALQLGSNVIVSAPTGTGKTFIATSAMKQQQHKNKIIIYTTPIKALSNEKFAQLSKEFDSVGLLTGDNKFNINANILVMTTEIYSRLLSEEYIRNFDRSIARNISLDDISLVIFDEAHYIFDNDRGHVWQESILFSKTSTQMLLLSATIHTDQLGDWIRKIIPSRPCEIISTVKRQVPLNHMTFQVAKDRKSDMEYNKQYCLFAKSGETFKYNSLNKLTNSIDKKIKEKNINNILLNGIGLTNYLIEYMKIAELKNKKFLPAIFFVLNRDRCEKWSELAKSVLTSKESSDAIKNFTYLIRQTENHDILTQTEHYKLLCKTIENGIAFHHSGLHPVLKEAVEILFGSGYIKILFATETFAVGVNYPAKTVVLTTLVKFDSVQKHRILNKHEYLQMSGRAGRRGFDSYGNVIVIDSRNFKELPNILTSSLKYSVPEYKLSYTLILRMMIHNLNLENIKNVYCSTMDKHDIIGVLNNIIVTDQIRNDASEYKYLSNCVFSGNKENKRKSRLKQLTSDDKLITYIHNEEKINRLNNCRNYANILLMSKINNLLFYEALIIDSDENYQITDFGKAMLEFDEHLNLLAMIAIIKNQYVEKLDEKDIIKLICMLSEQGNDEYISKDEYYFFDDQDDDQDNNKEITVDANEKSDFCESKISSSISDNYIFEILEEISKIYSLDDEVFTFNNKMSEAISVWYKKKLSLNDIAQKYKLKSGDIFKVISRIKNTIMEMYSACIILSKHTQADKLYNISNNINSIEILRDSLYLRKIELS